MKIEKYEKEKIPVHTLAFLLQIQSYCINHTPSLFEYPKSKEQLLQTLNKRNTDCFDTYDLFYNFYQSSSKSKFKLKKTNEKEEISNKVIEVTKDFGNDAKMDSIVNNKNNNNEGEKQKQKDGNNNDDNDDNDDNGVGDDVVDDDDDDDDDDDKKSVQNCFPRTFYSKTLLLIESCWGLLTLLSPLPPLILPEIQCASDVLLRFYIGKKENAG
eukprot:Pgem_evm1s6030